jgi:hypothetical protein
LYSRGKISWNAFDGNPTLPLNNINTIFATRVALDQAFENTPGPNVLINDDLQATFAMNLWRLRATYRLLDVESSLGVDQPVTTNRDKICMWDLVDATAEWCREALYEVTNHMVPDFENFTEFEETVIENSAPTSMSTP